MLEAVVKNLWMLLTLVIPGLFTYGSWRLLLILEPSKNLNMDALHQIDSSVIASASIVVAVALLQQIFAIAIESVLTALATIRKREWPNIYLLFHERFTLAGLEKLEDGATRVIGNFFLSINITAGILLLLLYFLFYEGMSMSQWVPQSIVIILVLALISGVFRMLNAKWTVEAHRPKR